MSDKFPENFWLLGQSLTFLAEFSRFFPLFNFFSIKPSSRSTACMPFHPCIRTSPSDWQNVRDASGFWTLFRTTIKKVESPAYPSGTWLARWALSTDYSGHSWKIGSGSRCPSFYLARRSHTLCQDDWSRGSLNLPFGKNFSPFFGTRLWIRHTFPLLFSHRKILRLCFLLSILSWAQEWKSCPWTFGLCFCPALSIPGNPAGLWDP